MSFLPRELRHAFRRLRKSPSSTIIAVFTMALGIGLCATMFSVVDAVVLRGLPFPESDKLLHLERSHLAEGIESLEVTHHDFEDWAAQQTSFEGLAAFNAGGTVNLADEGLPDRYNGAWLSTNFLDLLRVQPILGRSFEPADAAPGAGHVILIGHHVWQKRYGGDPQIVGRVARVNSEPAVILGVMPEGFRFPILQDVWLPLTSKIHDAPRGEGETLEVFGRLKDGVSVDEAAAEMATIAQRLAKQYPESNEGIAVVMKPYTEEFIGEEPRLMVGVMTVAVLLVLLIACVNVTNLLLGRASARSRELAIRSALGSGRLATILQVLAESTVLALLGGGIGLVLARYGVRAVDRVVAQSEPPFWLTFSLNTTALTWTLGATLLAALVAGIVPALQASRIDLNTVLQDSARGSSFRLGRLSRGLVTLEVAVSCALLVAAGLMVMSVVRANRYDMHFDTERLLVARMGLFEADHPEEQDWVRFYDRLSEQLGGRSEIESVAVGTVMPADNAIGGGGTQYERAGEVYENPRQMPFARYASIGPNYFKTLGVQPTAGRDFSLADNRDAAPVAIVNEDFARLEWPNENPIGQRINLWRGRDVETEDPDAGWVEVVGVVPTLLYNGFMDNEAQQGIYVPMAQVPSRFTWVIVRTRAEPISFAEPLRRAVLDLDPNLPLYYVRSMEQVLSQSMFFNNFFGAMFSIFGAVAMVLAAVGLYGVMAFGVTQRTREMGVRMAFGARAADVLRLIVRQGMKQVGVGLVLGLLLALGLSSVLAGFLFKVEPRDPMTYAATAILLGAAALLACFIPARRASGVDPIIALRHD